MGEYKEAQRLRRVKQLLVAPVFVAILVFGWQYPLFGFFIPLCMLLGIGFGFWRGRVWCNWYCPRGSFYDSIACKISPQKEIPLFLRDLRFRLMVLVFLMLVMVFNILWRWPNLTGIGYFFVFMLTATTIIGLALALFFHQRSWCMICPIGTLIKLTSGNIYPLKIDSDKCVECKLCSKVCPIQIKPYIYKSKGLQLVNDADCLKCGLCASACPAKALKRG